jgi:hypothetical protein
MSTPTSAHLSVLADCGFAWYPNSDTPAVSCASNPLEIFSCEDWDSLVRHVDTYILCDCPMH